MSEDEIISFLEFINQDDEDKYNMLVECAAIIRKKDNIIKEVREYIANQRLRKFADTTGGLTYEERKLLEILDKE